MRKILFLGYIVPQEEAQKYSGLSVAGNKMQLNIVDNLAKNNNADVYCISVAPLAPYPRDRIFHFHKQKFFDGRKIIEFVKFWNIPIIKQISQIVAVYRSSCKYMKENKDSTILCFNLFPQIGLPARWLKKRFPKTEIIPILADLPLDDKKNRSSIMRLLRDAFDSSTRKSIGCFSKYIVLNKNVADKFISEKSYIVVDGGIDESNIHQKKGKRKINKKNVIFSGALTDYNGVRLLIQAAELINDSIEIEIYGDGYLNNEVVNASKKNPKIKYRGKVSNDKMLEIQRNSWLLINPRLINDPISQMTFPSKTFEYLLSRRPILTTKLDAYGPEYYDHMFFCEDTAESIANAINNIGQISEDELQIFADRAYSFACREKTWEQQCKKIYDFMFGDLES